MRVANADARVSLTVDAAITGPSPAAPTRTRSLARAFVFGTLVVFIGLLAAGMRMRASGPIDKGPAPAFSMPLFDGPELNLADLKGKVVVLNFWASWCPPCKDEAPYFEKVYRQYKGRGVVFLGVDYMDTEKEAREFIQTFNITYPNGPDLRGKISQAYRIRGVPETFFIDKQGNLQGMVKGPVPQQELIQSIESLLRLGDNE